MKNIFTKFLTKEFITEGLKYLVVGGFCTVIDFLLLYLLVEKLFVNYVLASAISFSISVIVNYVLCTIWIFKTHTVKDKYKEFLFYLIISLVGLSINSGLIWLLTENLSLQFMVSKVVATPIVLLWNFLARKYFLHTNKSSTNKYE
jgi:putative flippase GtrA